jgi:6-pyruvoyltetrahydropterin/6-carboxytetrahydropterin synthase
MINSTDDNSTFRKELSKTIKEVIIDKVDHKNLNLDVDFMANKLASCEILVMEFWKILAPKISEGTTTNACLHKIHLIETNKNSVEYYGES